MNKFILYSIAGGVAVVVVIIALYLYTQQQSNALIQQSCMTLKSTIQTGSEQRDQEAQFTDQYDKTCVGITGELFK